MQALVRHTLLAVVATTWAATAASADCPDERATHVNAQVVHSTYHARCESSFELFGFEMTLVVECPMWIHVRPPHGACEGTPLEGHECVLDELLEIARYRCECVGMWILEDQLEISACQCRYDGVVGILESFETQACQPG